MVDFMLDRLCGFAGKSARVGMHGFILKIDFNAVVTGGRSRTVKREASFDGFILVFGMRDFRIEHDEDVVAVVYDCDDAFSLPDHIGGHAYAVLTMRGKCVDEVLRNL